MPVRYNVGLDNDVASVQPVDEDVWMADQLNYEL